MKLFIRVLWFFPTFALYAPIRNALESAGSSGLIVGLFHLVYFFFVYLIPSNAIIAMLSKTPNGRAKKLCRYIWDQVQAFSQKANLSMNECNSVYIFSAFCYATLDLVAMEGMGSPIKQQLLNSGVRMLAPSSRYSATMVMSQIEYGFDKMISDFFNRNLSVTSPEGLVDIFELTMDECGLNMFDRSELFEDFSKRLMNVRKFAAERV